MVNHFASSPFALLAGAMLLGTTTAAAQQGEDTWGASETNVSGAAFAQSQPAISDTGSPSSMDEMPVFDPPPTPQGEPLVAKDEKPDGKWPEGFEPFVLGQPEGPGTLKIELAVQSIYEMTATGVDTMDSHLTDYGGKFRRLRFVLSGHLGLPSLTYLLHMSTLPSSLELMDFYLDYRIAGWISIRAGNVKVPFTRYRNNSFKGLCMVDWGIVTQFFGAERQKGFLLHNGYGKKAGFEYEFGILTGVASRPPHAKGMASLYGETVKNPSDLTAPALNERIHPEIALHIAWNHGEFDHSPEADIEAGPPRVSAGLSVAWDTRPQRGIDVSVRIAPELWLKAHGFHMQMTGYLGFAELGMDVSDTSVALVGAVASAGYTHDAIVDVSLQYAMLASTEALREDAMDRASRIIAGAASNTELVNLMEKYGKAGTFELQQEASVGLTFFIIGQNLKWTSDLAWIAVTSDAAATHQLRFRSQLQLVF